MYLELNYCYWFNCSEQTRIVLTSAAYVHLKQADLSKHIRNLSPASRAILLSGPAGKYIRFFLVLFRKYNILHISLQYCRDVGSTSLKFAKLQYTPQIAESILCNSANHKESFRGNNFHVCFEMPQLPSLLLFLTLYP